MGATRRGTYAAAEAATAATGSEARPSQASPSAAAAGGDGASPMVNEGAPMVDDAGDEDEESSDEEDEVVMDIAKKLECGGTRKNHARTQVTLPAGTQPPLSPFTRQRKFMSNTLLYGSQINFFDGD